MTVASVHSSPLAARCTGPLDAGLGPLCPADRPPPPTPLWRLPLRALDPQPPLVPPPRWGESPSCDVDQAVSGSKAAAFFTKTRTRP